MYLKISPVRRRYNFHQQPTIWKNANVIENAVKQSYYMRLLRGLCPRKDVTDAAL